MSPHPTPVVPPLVLTSLTAVIFNVLVRGPTKGTAEMALLSVVHFGARVAQGLFYIVGFSTLRTMAFVVACVSNVALYVLLLEKVEMY
jgi:hypothetical protein